MGKEYSCCIGDFTKTLGLKGHHSEFINHLTNATVGSKVTFLDNDRENVSMEIIKFSDTLETKEDIYFTLSNIRGKGARTNGIFVAEVERSKSISGSYYGIDVRELSRDSYDIDKEPTYQYVTSWDSLDYKDVSITSPMSRIGGIPTDSHGEPLALWPHYRLEDGGSIALVFQSQYILPNGKMLWTFSTGLFYGGLTEYKEYVPTITKIKSFDISKSIKPIYEEIDTGMGQEKWDSLYNNNVGQPIVKEIPDDGYTMIEFALIEDSPLPDYIFLDTPLDVLLPDLTHSRAYAMPSSDSRPTLPSWEQGAEIPDEAPLFLYQLLQFTLDEGEPYSHQHSDAMIYVFWNGKDIAKSFSQWG